MSDPRGWVLFPFYFEMGTGVSVEIEDGHLRGGFFLYCIITAVDKYGESLNFCGLDHVLRDIVIVSVYLLKALSEGKSRTDRHLYFVPFPPSFRVWRKYQRQFRGHEMSCHQFLPLAARIPKERECTIWFKIGITASTSGNWSASNVASNVANAALILPNWRMKSRVIIHSKFTVCQ